MSYARVRSNRAWLVTVDEAAAELLEQVLAGAALVEGVAIGSGVQACPDGEEVGLESHISPPLIPGKTK